MFKLYRVWNEEETKQLKNGIMNFKTKDCSLIPSQSQPINTFDYGKDKNSSLALKKHFFLFEEDAFTYSKYLDEAEKYVNVFCVPEELVINNLGFSNIRGEFFPLEVAISSKEIAQAFNLTSVNSNSCFETLNIKDSNFYISEEEMIQEKGFSYKVFSSMLNDILAGFYENEEFSLERAKIYLDDENNRKMLVEKVKELFKY